MSEREREIERGGKKEVDDEGVFSLGGDC